MISVKNTLRNIVNNNIFNLMLEKHIFSPNNCVRVLGALSSNTSLTGLTIRGCRTDMDTLAIMLSNNNSLISLNLCHIGLTDDDIYTLARTLSMNTNLKMLCITDTFSKESLKALTTGLANNKSITHLSLSGCNIGDDDVSLITDMLSKNISIASLDLEWTHIGDKGIVELMSSPNNLIGLNLNHMRNVTNNGIKLFTQIIMNNNVITNIFFDHNTLELNKLLARNVIYKKYKYRFDIPDELNDLVNKHISNYCYYAVPLYSSELSKISFELATFFGVNPDTMFSRNDCVKKISDYIKAHGLKPSNSHDIIPDIHLTNLFSLNPKDKFTYFDLHRNINRHMVK